MFILNIAALQDLSADSVATLLRRVGQPNDNRLHPRVSKLFSARDE